MYKFTCKDNHYQTYQYVETKTFQPIDHITQTPTELKLFVNDVFDYNENGFILYHSSFKCNKMNPGILNLTMTYGKEKNKFLYLCKPDDKRIPFFLIPYNKPLEFDKSVEKLYITFEFKHWNNERPYGTVTQNLGNITILNHYYEYALYCKSLNISIQKFNKEVKEKLQHQNNQLLIKTIATQHNMENRNKSDYYIFTLDSSQSNDYDDAISYDKKEHKISIYITNVALIMDHLDLWGAFSNRISTIYLPDRKRTMLPSLLIDALCSLKEKEYKLCYVLDLFYDENNELKNHEFKTCRAYIRKNVSYDDHTFFETNETFQSILSILKIKHSKQIITKLMLLFNHYVAMALWEKKEGIYKMLQQEKIEEEQNPNIPTHVYEHICILKNKAAKYCSYNPNIVYQSSIHKDIHIYTQVSSPIRRLVDLLNNIKFLHLLCSIKMSDKSIQFYDKWTTHENMEYINISSRAIRKIQSKCMIYKQYEINKSKGEQPLYKGYIFDKAYKEGDGKYQYMVYVPCINLTTYVTLIEDLINYSCHCFSLYVFMNQENDKQKIKLQLCYEESL